MTARWRIVYLDHNWVEERWHLYEPGHARTWLGADWQRRFRHRYFGMSSAFTLTTTIVPEDDPNLADLAERGPDPFPDDAWESITGRGVDPTAVKAVIDAGLDATPFYAEHLERFVWRPLYWLRNRWDGLRYGLDRDRRR